MADSISRRQFLRFSAAGLSASVISPCMARAEIPEPKLQWFDVQDWGVEGKGWTDTAQYFDRLPARAHGKVPPAVWNLSRHSAGMLVRFRTDAPTIWTDHTVTSSSLSMPNMTAIGKSGLDLYATTPEGELRWVAVTKPSQQRMKGPIVDGLVPGERDYQLYLPLYNGTKSLSIGVPEGASFTPIEPRTEKPLLFYGTSITHGASASRPGMPHVAILGRRLNKPVINLGFSGNGRMEKEVGDFLAELDPAVYIIDCLPNMTENLVKDRAAPLVRQLRAARPKTPIVLVEDRTYANTPFRPSLQSRIDGSRKALRQARQTLQDEGVENLIYIEGDTLLGNDREDTTDGSHPSDLGFWRQANTFEPVLRKALGES